MDGNQEGKLVLYSGFVGTGGAVKALLQRRVMGFYVYGPNTVHMRVTNGTRSGVARTPHLAVRASFIYVVACWQSNT